eukprot:5398510-Pyramimonas_sp.AAC.1
MWTIANPIAQAAWQLRPSLEEVCAAEESGLPHPEGRSLTTQQGMSGFTQAHLCQVELGKTMDLQEIQGTSSN